MLKKNKLSTQIIKLIGRWAMKLSREINSIWASWSEGLHHIPARPNLNRCSSSSSANRREDSPWLDSGRASLLHPSLPYLMLRGSLECTWSFPAFPATKHNTFSLQRLLFFGGECLQNGESISLIEIAARFRSLLSSGYFLLNRRYSLLSRFAFKKRQKSREYLRRTWLLLFCVWMAWIIGKLNFPSVKSSQKLLFSEYSLRLRLQ